jgi:hypothetical protein
MRYVKIGVIGGMVGAFVVGCLECCAGRADGTDQPGIV